MLHIFGDEVDDGRQRIVVGNDIEIEGPAYKMGKTVGKIELERGGSIASLDGIGESEDVVSRVDILLLADRVGFLDMLVHKGVGIFQINRQVPVDPLIGNMEGCFVPGIDHINPIWFGHRAAVGHNLGIHRIFKRKRESGIK